MPLTRRTFLAAFAPVVPAPQWNGYEKRTFAIEGYAGCVVRPRTARPGNPWLWRARFPDYHPEYAFTLLSKGFHLAWLDLPNNFGNPAAMAAWDRFYDHVVDTFRLAPKMALEGVSRGGLYVYNWAVKYPHRINCIYCESPVCDMKSWPGGKGQGIGSPKDWQEALRSYGFTEDQMLAFRGNPIDHAARLAAARIPILHVVSDRDRIVPPAENTDIFAARYAAHGGPITVYRNTGMPDSLNGHHFPLDAPTSIVDFILRHTPGM